MNRVDPYPPIKNKVKYKTMVYTTLEAFTFININVITIIAQIYGTPSLILGKLLKFNLFSGKMLVGMAGVCCGDLKVRSEFVELTFTGLRPLQ